MQTIRRLIRAIRRPAPDVVAYETFWIGMIAVHAAVHAHED